MVRIFLPACSFVILESGRNKADWIRSVGGAGGDNAKGCWTASTMLYLCEKGTFQIGNASVISILDALKTGRNGTDYVSCAKNERGMKG